MGAVSLSLLAAACFLMVSGLDALSQFPDELGRCDNDMFSAWIGMAVGCVSLAVGSMAVAGFGLIRSGQRWHAWTLGSLLVLAAAVAAFAVMMLVVSPFASDSCVTYF
jgi:hypothetical protein